jgi:flagellar hook-associated protein 2
MNITDLFSSNISMGSGYGNSSAAAAAGGVSAATVALQRAGQRLQDQLDATNAQLSSFGQLKSALSDAQLAGRALGGLSATSGGGDVNAALAQFVAKYNTAITTAGATAALPGNPVQAASANRAGNDMRHALTSSLATLDMLRKLGISQQADGTLALDSAKLAAAQQADPSGTLVSMGKLGARVDSAAGKELADNGDVDGSMTSLTTRTTSLQSQQKALLTALQNLAGSSGSSGFLSGN